MNVVQLYERIFEPLVKVLTPGVARLIVSLKADEEMIARLDELATKANQGKLTDVERAEYKDFTHVLDLISVMQAKAQRVLDAAG
jgi:hypothetical protein